jgi:CRISPR-associated endonuclease/helicase Cas3
LAKGKPENTPLYTHLMDVVEVAVKLAGELNMCAETARIGAILHDIGKASPVFQERLFSSSGNQKTFRHEIASCFFISMIDKEQMRQNVIEMIVAHHKSVLTPGDSHAKGIIDLYENTDYAFAFHAGEWESWMPKAMEILRALGLNGAEISVEQARKNYEETLAYCEGIVRQRGYSPWRGLMIAADHFSSALQSQSGEKLSRIFKSPDLSFYERQHALYPLSSKAADSDKPHTLVTACTGAGKTDYLLRRCRGRVFYMLPFQASINAMFNRIKADLEDKNPELDIRLLHGMSQISGDNKDPEETALQNLVGSSVKVLTPHQVFSVIFGLQGYEALILDLKGCDIILDEIHVYNNVTQAMVVKVIEVLKHLHCRIHIGTATMPSKLYAQIVDILGPGNVLETRLDEEELSSFDRHRVHKLEQWAGAEGVVSNAIQNQQKILLVHNRVADSQQSYNELKAKHPETDIMLIHSRFRRGDRAEKERLLMDRFNRSDKACIVISTQVVEVSLDISFDVMVTQAAPIDALIQRFGRINRKRTEETIGKYKDVYVIQPPEGEKEAKPYDPDVLQRSYNALPDGEVLQEKDLQKMIDRVYPEMQVMDIENQTVYKQDGSWRIGKLTHRKRSILFEMLEIDNVACICRSDEEGYKDAGHEERLRMEIPARYWSVRHLDQCWHHGSEPYLVPDEAYTQESGLDVGKCKRDKQNNYEIL